jgi:hypothetical protein
MTLKMDAVRASEMPVDFYRTTRHHILEYGTLLQNVITI